MSLTMQIVLFVLAGALVLVLAVWLARSEADRATDPFPLKRVTPGRLPLGSPSEPITRSWTPEAGVWLPLGEHPTPAMWVPHNRDDK